MSVLAMLVALGAGSPVWAQKVTPVTTLISTASTGDSEALAVEFYNSVSFTVAMSSTGTVLFKTSGNGTDYAALSCLSVADVSGAAVTSITAGGTYQCNVAAMQKVKVTVSANAGTITVQAQASSAVPGLASSSGGGTQYAEDAAHGSGDTGTLALGVRKDTAASLAGADGDYTAPIFDALNRLWTRPAWLTPNGDTLIDDTNDAVRTTAITVTAVSGNVAHGAAESQSPVITGCHATASVSGETLVTAGYATRCYAGRDGVPLVRPDASLEDLTYAVVTATTGANTSLVAALGSGIKACIRHIIINAIGTTSNNYAILTDGSGGTTKADLVYPSGSAATYVFPVPNCSTANTAWFVDSQGTETLRITVGYFKSQE
jgi:hypothetical protein